MNSNILSKLTMATITTFIVTGTAMATTPYAFDQYTVTNGAITDNGVDPDGAGPLDNCAGGFTCTRLEANGNGIMQRNVTDTGTGVSYLQTVITDSDANGSAASLGFSTEAFVFAAGNSANNITLQQRISDAGMDTNVLVHEGAFETGGDLTDPNSTGDGVHLEIDQTVSLGAPDFVEFIQTGQNGNQRQIVNERTSGQGTDGRFTSRTVSGATFAPSVAGTLGGIDFENETTLGIGATYNAGDTLQVVWQGADQPNNQQFGLQDYNNLTSGETASKDGLTGNMGQFTDNGPWEWDPIFGNAPNPPPTTPAFP